MSKNVLMQTIGEKEVNLFKINGFVKVNNLFPNDLINNLMDEINTSDVLGAADGAVFDLINEKKEFRYVPRAHIALPSIQKLVNSEVLSASSKLLNETVYLVGVDLHCRAAGSTHPTPPHQDSFLFCLKDGYESLITCYISMSGMNSNDASLRFIRGSHLLPTIQHKQSSVRGFSSVIEDNSRSLSKEMLQNEEIIELQKGECVFFHSKTIHYTNQDFVPTKSRTSVSIRIGGYSVEYSVDRQRQYKEFVKNNRLIALDEGLTSSIPNPQHI